MQKTGKIKVGLSCFVVALILAFFIPAAMFPAETKAVCSAMYSFITKDLAWLMFVCFIAVIGGSVYMTFSRHGRVRLGGRDAKPEFTNFEYISMNMCGALAAGVVVLGFSEWSYYVTDTPFQIAPGSVQAYEWRRGSLKSSGPGSRRSRSRRTNMERRP